MDVDFTNRASNINNKNKMFLMDMSKESNEMFLTEFQVGMWVYR